MSPWREKLLGETRTKLLKMLRHTPMTVVEMAEALGLSTNGIRVHLSWLTAHGLVAQAGTHRDTGGKPAQFYSISANGEELFPKAYSTVLTGVMNEIDRHGARRGHLKELMCDVGEHMAGGLVIPRRLESRVNAAAQAVRDMGGDVAVEETVGGWRISGHGCPLSAAVAARSETCELVRSLIERVSGCEVSTHCECGSQPNCCFELSRRVA